jgi:tRNA modification GTPase
MTRGPQTPNAEHRTPVATTAAAVLTPIGQAGIAIVHVVGPRAFELASEVFRPKHPLPPEPDAGRLHYGHIVDGDEVIDEVLVRFGPADAVRGGEPTVEVNCHGGIVAVQRVLDCFEKRGVEALDPEAFVERQARSRIEVEAVQALLRAATPLGVEILLDQLNGALEIVLRGLPWGEPAIAAETLRELLATERLGRALWQPRRVAIVGPANAGKSTLFNALSREDRMIVSPRPGTTRDTVTAEVAIGGVPVWLTDTAGEREPGSAIEVEAIARSRSAAAAADFVLLVLDGSIPLPAPLEAMQAALPASHLAVANKADLGLSPWAQDACNALVVSAARGDGLGELCRRVARALVGEARREPGRAVVFTKRQARLLQEALEAVEAWDLDKARELTSALLQPPARPGPPRHQLP